ncbi:MAG: polysaccharide deacetylase [Oscillospiraceae bacterium]|jgi:peptidoglycan/xylan/chitin deacetylase (PgdA/CDA1 family)|nr:polysaccharide deacetylase [Oscillospiraceae bacterium]
MYIRRRLIRGLAALLCVALLFAGGALAPARLRAAAEPTVYFIAVGYTVLPLADGAMPITSGVTLYAPHRAFTSGTGIFSSIMYQPHYLSLFGPNRSLTFDIERNVSFDQDRMYSDTLIYQGGTYYVPVDAVCQYFGLTYAVLDTAYGKLLRIRLPSTAQDDATFLNAAADTIERRYREYANPPTPTPPSSLPGVVLPAAPSASPSPTPTPTQPPQLVAYLTFDDGPKKDGSTERILDTLDAYGVRATFFLLGTNMRLNEDSIRRMAGTGHAIGLHGYTHKADVFYASPEAMLDELTRTNDALYEAATIRTRLVRTPYGSWPYLTPELREVMSDNGYRFWDWNVDPKDSEGKPTKESIYASTVSQLENRVQRREGPSVILLHDKHTTADTLPALLDYMVAQGYTFRVITENELPSNFHQYVK